MKAGDAGGLTRAIQMLHGSKNERALAMQVDQPAPAYWRSILRATLASIAAVAASAAFAATTTVSTLIDSDNNMASGCTVSTANGPFAGVDRVLNTVVVTDATGYRIQSINLQFCNGGALGAPSVIDASSTPLARGNGTSGATAVETYIPNRFLPAEGQKMRVGVTTLGSDGLTGADALTLTGTSAILVDGPALIVIPTLAKLSLALTALLLALSVWYGRRRPGNNLDRNHLPHRRCGGHERVERFCRRVQRGQEPTQCSIVCRGVRAGRKYLDTRGL